MKPEAKRSILQLSRLERIMDVVFALVIWRLFTFLPTQQVGGNKWASVSEMLLTVWKTYVFVLLAVVIVIIYWLQNNSLLGNLKKTDAIHTAISVFQVFFVLLFIYSIGAGIRIGSGADSRVFESFTAMMVGVLSLLSWYYAMHKDDLLDPALSREEAVRIRDRNLAEPLTAAITIPFAFVGPLAWELSWLAYPFIKYLFKNNTGS
ncbi:MAG: hypothetical protein LJE83_01530 [Gammaproteobacteria bacterium]|nr:hypothetical protein [Gammaproteobacteria bacterium]